MSNSEVRELEESIERHKRDISLLNALESLQRNKHFIEVITQGFCTDKAVQLVQLKAQSNMQSPEYQAAVIREIDGIGTLVEYFKSIQANGEIAKRSLNDDQETLAQVLTELN